MLYLLLGVLVGFLSGLLGIGGGVLIAPALLFIFQQQGLFSHYAAHVAAGTSLAVITFTSLSSIIAYQQKRSIAWSLVKPLLPGIIVGSIAGTFIAILMPGEFLSRFLGVFMLLAAVQMLLPKPVSYQKKLPNRWVLMGLGVLISMVGSLVGVGGGILLIPFLAYYQVPLRLAAGTVVTCTFFVALTGIANLMIIPHVLPLLKTDYIFWPAIWQMAPTSIVFAWMGTSVAHRLSVDVLKRIFALFLALVGIYTFRE